MQLRTARLCRVLKCPTPRNSLACCLPVYVPVVAGHSYATTRPIRRDNAAKDNGALKFRKAPKGGHTPKQSPPKYSSNGVPALPDLQAMLQHPAAPAYLKGMTAVQAHGVLTEFAQRRHAYLEARDSRPHGLITEQNQRIQAHDPQRTKWPWVLQGLLRGDPANKPAVLATLHSLACVLLFNSGGQPWIIALDILRDLGFWERYAPSDLTLVRLAQAGNRMDRPMFTGAIERLTTGRIQCETDTDHANYETLRGLMCASSSTTERAARDALWWFQRALDPQKGRRAPGAFDWQAACMVEMGRCYTRVGDVKKAIKVWEIAARELDSPQATNLYATAAMDDRDPRTEEWLTRAALGSDRTAQAGLARIQKAKWEDAESKGVKGWELTFRKFMKDEWETLATDMPQAR